MVIMVTSQLTPNVPKIKKENEIEKEEKEENERKKLLWRKWQEAIQKEFGNIKKQQVWRKICTSLILLNCRCMKNKRVFKIKYKSVH